MSYQSWKTFGSGKSGFAYSLACRANNRFSCELYIDETTEDELITWSIEKLKSFKNVFSKYIKEL